MARAIEEHTDNELRALIENYQRAQALTAPRYLEAIDELARRTGNGLDIQKSVQLIRSVASEDKFLSYKQLAEQSGADWSKVHWALFKHLGELIDYAHGNGWPLLSAVVVNQSSIATGELEPSALRGFVEAARGLGYNVVDEIGFLKEQQAKVFEWARLPIEGDAHAEQGA